MDSKAGLVVGVEAEAWVAVRVEAVSAGSEDRSEVGARVTPRAVTGGAVVVRRRDRK